MKLWISLIGLDECLFDLFEAVHKGGITFEQVVRLKWNHFIELTVSVRILYNYEKTRKINVPYAKL